MMRWPVWMRFCAINGMLPWSVVLMMRATGVNGALALLIVLCAAVVLVLMNFWHLRASSEWRWFFGFLMIANPVCTLFFGNLALATAFRSIWLVLRMAAFTE